MQVICSGGFLSDNDAIFFLCVVLCKLFYETDTIHAIKRFGIDDLHVYFLTVRLFVCIFFFGVREKNSPFVRQVFNCQGKVTSFGMHFMPPFEISDVCIAYYTVNQFAFCLKSAEIAEIRFFLE